VDDGRPRALLISGTVGAGKTTAAEAVGERLRERGVPHAVIDLDQLRRRWPSPPADPFDLSVELANLTAVASTYLAAGAQRLVLAGVLEDRAARERYRRAVGVPLHVARLAVDVPVARERLRRRHAGQDDVLAWHLHRAGELHAALEAAGADDSTVEATGLSREQVADALVTAAGWT
jgi:predicted kinase